MTDFRRTGIGSERETNSEGSVTYRHSFPQKGHEFSLELRRSESAETQHRRYTSIYQIPPGQISMADQSPHADEIERELSADYTLRTGGLESSNWAMISIGMTTFTTTVAPRLIPRPECHS